MGELVGLEGTKRALPCVYASSPTSAMRLIARHRAVTAAGDDGALSVWIDDAGVLRSEFMRYRATLNAAVHPTRVSLRAWLKEWWPRMGSSSEIAHVD